MKKIIYSPILILGLIVLLSSVLFLVKNNKNLSEGNIISSENLSDLSKTSVSIDTSVLQGQKAIVYKGATCGCCAVYVSYLKNKGLDVEVVDVPNITDIKRVKGVPPDLSSCHTTEIGGYVVEGHIPVEAIAKLLLERPNIVGIAMPGMPIGSPGMPGKKEFPFEIYKLGEEGLFMTI